VELESSKISSVASPLFPKQAYFTLFTNPASLLVSVKNSLFETRSICYGGNSVKVYISLAYCKYKTQFILYTLLNVEISGNSP